MGNSHNAYFVATQRNQMNRKPSSIPPIPRHEMQKVEEKKIVAASKSVTKKTEKSEQEESKKPAAANSQPKKQMFKGAQRDNYECLVCYELCAQPVLPPCKHFMCFQCHKRVAERNMTCPMCRAQFSQFFIPTVDKELQRQIQREMGQQFEERKSELIAAGEWLRNKYIVKFMYGNTYELVQNPRMNRSGTKSMAHRWGTFVTINGDPALTSRYIKSVTYHLHPTYPEPVVKTEKPPFELTKLAWGWFEVRFEIVFQPTTGVKKRNLHHTLIFSGTGQTKSIMIEIDDIGTELGNRKAVARELGERIDAIEIAREND